MGKKACLKLDLGYDSYDDYGYYDEEDEHDDAWRNDGGCVSHRDEGGCNISALQDTAAANVSWTSTTI